MTYFIIFPGGDRNKISVLELSQEMRYELNDYSVASRREFEEEKEAVEYATQLATKHNKEYMGNDDGYLD